MLSASSEFRQLIAQNTKVLLKATVTFSYGTLELTGDDFMEGSISFDEATSSTSSFDIGAAIVGKFSCTLNNYDRRFNGEEFTGAKIEPSVGLELSDGSVEWIRKGVYYIERPDTYGYSIGLQCYDSLSLLERDYGLVNTKYPATLRTIVQDVCQFAGITLSNPNFKNNAFVVKERPDSDSETCLSILSYAAQIAGCYVKVDPWGRVVLDWYDRDSLLALKEVWLDGGTFNYIGGGDQAAYGDGDSADGGDFDNYASGWSVSGGDFFTYSGSTEVGTIEAISSMSMGTDEIVITGIRVSAEDENDELQEFLYGEEGYVLDISDNPLIAADQIKQVAEQVGISTVHMTFRAFDAQIVANPILETSDPIDLIDPNGIHFTSFITNLTYKIGNYQTISCSAETPAVNSSSASGAITKALLKTREEILREKTARELAMEEMAHRLANSGGLYVTTEEQSDGSSIYYMHDKPTLEESKVVWKLTAEVLGMSTDGGETYPYALSVDGNTILNRIYAIGLDASYITTGALVVKDPNSQKTMFSADVDTGIVSISADSVSIGERSVAEELGIQTSNIAYLQQDINGLKSSVSSIAASYGSCATAASVQAKVVTCENFTLDEGSLINVKFTNANTATQPTLNVQGTGAKYIYVNNAIMTSTYYWAAGNIKTFLFADGHWNMIDDGVAESLSSVTNRVSTLEQTTTGITSTVSAMKVAYGTCSTAAGTQTKVVSAPGFTLYTGAEITVRFSNANNATNPILNVNNTGGKYIYVNSTYMTREFYWKAGGVMTFKYNGSQWVAIDSSTLSLIKQTADSISLSVSGSLGSTASIKLSVNGSTSTSNIDMSKVRNAFANDKSTITISAGTVTFNSNTFVVNSTNFSVTSTGVITAKSGTIGAFTIGSNYLNYNGKTSHWNTATGLLINSAGISTANGTYYCALTSGTLWIGTSASTYSYIKGGSVNGAMSDPSYETCPSGVGLTIGASRKGSIVEFECSNIILRSPGATTAYLAISKTINVITDIVLRKEEGWVVGATLELTPIEFWKGMLIRRGETFAKWL